jgi:hypothetical protein
VRVTLNEVEERRDIMGYGAMSIPAQASVKLVAVDNLLRTS